MTIIWMSFFSLSAFELGTAVAAVETGSLNPSAVVLMQSGFNSRIAAIKAVTETNATFSSTRQMSRWIKSKKIEELFNDLSWPTPETHNLWAEFVITLDSAGDRTWKSTRRAVVVKWTEGVIPASGSALRIRENDAGESLVLSSDYELLGVLNKHLNPDRKGLFARHIWEISKAPAGVPWSKRLGFHVIGLLV